MSPNAEVDDDEGRVLGVDMGPRERCVVEKDLRA